MDSIGVPHTAVESPPWQPGTRLAAGMALLVLLVGVIFVLRPLLSPLVLAFFLAYLLHPVVSRLTRLGRIRRGTAVLIVYLILIMLLISATTGLGLASSQRIIRLGSYFATLSEDLPEQIQALAGQSFTIWIWEIDLAEINLEPFLNQLASAVQPLLAQTGNLLATVASTIASAVTLIFLVLILGYYMLLDFGDMDLALLEWVPPRYRGDVQILLDETAAIWNAFIRGQAILALIIGLTAWIVLTALGVRFSLALGLIAGVLEFVPMFGPLISAVAAVLVALFQGSNIWGISQLGFGLIVLAIFMLIQQIENNVLVPRIIGRSLNLHPLTVLVALLGGGVIGGVLGLLLAAPTVATTRTCLGYVYRKAVGLETWPVSYSTVPDPPEGFGSRWRRWLRRRGAKESSGDADQATAEVE